jgi:hypothetical protein
MTKKPFIAIVALCLFLPRTFANTDFSASHQDNLDTAKVGELYSYPLQDLVDGIDASYSAVGLPAGFAIGTDGTLTGITYTPGVFDVVIIATSQSGEKTIQVRLTVVENNDPGFIFENSLQLFPNPFEIEMRINYTLADKCDLEIKVYSDNGEMMKTLVDQEQDEGDYTLLWDGTDDTQKELQDGWYFIQLIVSNESGIIYQDMRKILKVSSKGPAMW